MTLPIILKKTDLVKYCNHICFCHESYACPYNDMRRGWYGIPNPL